MRDRRSRAQHHAGTAYVLLVGTPCHSRSEDPGNHVACDVTSIGRLGGRVVAIETPCAAAMGVGHQPADSPEVQRLALVLDEREPEQLKENLRMAKGDIA